MQAEDYLFSGKELSEFLELEMHMADEYLNAIPRDQFLAAPDDDVVGHLVSQYSLDPLAIHEDRMTQQQDEVTIDVGPRSAGFPGQPFHVHGIRVTVCVPFSGNEGLWSLRPSSRFTGVTPRGRALTKDWPPGVERKILEMTIDYPLHESMDRAKQGFEQNLQLLREYLRFQKFDVERYNRELPDKLREKVRGRRERLAKQSELADLLAIPLARRDGSPAFKPLPLQKRLVKPLPPPPAGGYQPEPGITDQDYEDVLSVIRHVGRTFEVTPRTYAVHGEEELRDILLANLNGHYKGLAAGETFRGAGKTDIRIEAENRAAFIAECKIWRGPSTVTESLDQLLGYLTWRDCKTALILFNKDVAGFSELLAKVGPTGEVHPKFVKMVRFSGDDGEWRCVFRSKHDDAKLVHIHVFLLNIYSPTQ